MSIDRIQDQLATSEWAGGHGAPADIARPRLLSALEAASHRSLTLICAPAGWGKTALLTNWLRGPRAPGEVVRLPAGRHPQTSYQRVADRLGATSAPVTAVVDGHDDDDLLLGLMRVLEVASPRLRLVVSCRAEPSLALTGWRVRGELTELRAGQLAFTAAEAEDLLTAYGLRLPCWAVEELCALTEGRPAGLRLAARAMWRHPVPEQLVGVLAAFGAEPAGYDQQSGPVESLTPRETTILRYLQGSLSNVEIAALLHVSINTVKTHVKNIYRKLQAGHRREAVRRARQLHLL